MRARRAERGKLLIYQWIICRLADICGGSAPVHRLLTLF
jgi:hypothetical protein